MGADEWLRVVGGNTPSPTVEVNLPEHLFAPEPEQDPFDSEDLNLHWQSLRVPVDPAWLSLSARPGHLRLVGRESPISLHHQSRLGRRLQSFYADAYTKIDCHPTSFQQMAGLSAYYNASNWVSLFVTHDELLGTCLKLTRRDNGVYSELPVVIQVPEQPVHLGVRFSHSHFQFYCSLNGASWRTVGEPFNSRKLSDDYCGGLSFTGTFITLSAHDLTGNRLPADFDQFTYQEFLELEGQNQGSAFLEQGFPAEKPVLTGQKPS